MLDNLKKLLLISRPVSWVNTAYPFGAALLLTGGKVDALFWIGVVYFLIPYNLLMYGINDVFDYESDIRNPRKGGIEGAKVRKALHPLIVRAAIWLNIPFIIYLLFMGTWLANITLIAVVFLVVAYSAKGLRFKEIPILDSITSSLHFVGPMIYALTLTGIDTTHWPYIAAFFLWGAASHAFGAVQDIIPDRQGNLSSIATILGARLTTRLVFALYCMAAIILTLQGSLAIIAGGVALMYAFNVAPYLNSTDDTSGRTNRGWRRFIWLNLIAGFVITMLLLVHALSTIG